MKAPVGAFNQEKALVGAFFVTVKSLYITLYLGTASSFSFLLMSSVLRQSGWRGRDMHSSHGSQFRKIRRTCRYFYAV